MFWFYVLVLTGCTVAAMLWPLMQKTPVNRWHLAALLLISVIVPAGAIALYYWLGSPPI